MQSLQFKVFVGRCWSRFPIPLIALSLLVAACQQKTASESQPLVPFPEPQTADPILPSQTTPFSASGGYLSAGINPPAIVESVEYDVRQRLTLANKGSGTPDKQNIWIALVGDVFPFQQVNSREITPESYQISRDEYGNEYAEFDFSGMPPESVIQIEINYKILVNQLNYDLNNCEGELPDLFTQPELHIESDNLQIVDLAQQLSVGKQSVCQKVEAIYNYVGNNLVYSYNGADWGAQAALGEMGADCTEYSDLMIALARAMGIPAQYFEGVLYMSKDTAGLAQIEHAWLVVYLPGIGWTPMDPTLGRSSVKRQDYFAKITPDHIIVTRGRHPSTLRGSSYFSHVYWPGNSTQIKVENFDWKITPRQP